MTLAIQNSTGTLTVNPVFLQEIKDDNQRITKLLGLLRKFTERPSLLETQGRRFVRLLGELTDQIAVHFSLEEAYGYFGNALDVVPRLAGHVERLRAEHRDLYIVLRDLWEAAEDSVNGRVDASSLRQIALRFQQFDGQLSRHEEKETRLILKAFGRDAAMDGDGGVGKANASMDITMDKSVVDMDVKASSSSFRQRQAAGDLTRVRDFGIPAGQRDSHHDKPMAKHPAGIC